MRNWKLTLEYDGTKYSGWQEQKNARTVAGEIRKAAEEIFETEVDLHGAGRTDSGVHAAAQVAHLKVKTTRRLKTEDILRELNRRLPGDIAVLDVSEAPARFHARHDATSRAYVYHISTRKTAFSKRHVWWVKEKLDVASMARAAKMIEGKHNFSCFRAVDPSKPGESPSVVVEHATIEVEEHLIRFRIVASHFLWRMVRRLVGVLVKIGKGEVTVEQFEAMLTGRNDDELDVAAWTAPSSGLCLDDVLYPGK
jgi:tRNA pseudouridine38-40 synthase